METLSVTNLFQKVITSIYIDNAFPKIANLEFCIHSVLNKVAHQFTDSLIDLPLLYVINLKHLYLKVIYGNPWSLKMKNISYCFQVSSSCFPFSHKHSNNKVGYQNCHSYIAVSFNPSHTRCPLFTYLSCFSINRKPYNLNV